MSPYQHSYIMQFVYVHEHLFFALWVTRAGRSSRQKMSLFSLVKSFSTHAQLSLQIGQDIKKNAFFALYKVIAHLRLRLNLNSNLIFSVFFPVWFVHS